MVGLIIKKPTNKYQRGENIKENERDNAQREKIWWYKNKILNLSRKK